MTLQVSICVEYTFLYSNYSNSITPVGNVYIAETGNSIVRKVLANSSIISTVAGTGIGGYSGDNASATSATLSYPTAIAIDTAGKYTCLKTGGLKY